MKNYTLVALLVLLFHSATAQPTLTAATSNPVIGEQFYTYYCKTAGVPPGAAGAGITWDYSALVDTAFDTVSIMACGSTPYCDSFLGDVTSVMVQMPSNQHWALHTDAASWGLTDANDPLYATFLHHVRPYHFLKYPLNYGDTWHDTSFYTVPANHQHTFLSQYHTADAYGTLITPAGTFTNTIRMHVTSYLADTHFVSTPVFVQYFRTEDYYWYEPGTHRWLLGIHKLVDSADAIESIARVTFSTPTALVGVADVGANKEVSVFPNPASSVFHVALPAGYEEADIALTDMTGRVLTSAPGKRGLQREVPVLGLPPGVYMMQVRKGVTEVVRKVVVD